MTFMEELYHRRDCFRMRGGELAQIDLLSWPAGSHRRERRHYTRIRINATQRVGVTAFCAARVEQKIVEVPKNEVVVTLGQSEALVASGLDLEKDLAIHQQREKLEPGKTVLPMEPFNLLRRRQCGDRSRDLRIANSEQCAGARRFQHHLVAAPPHVRKA